LPVLEEAQRNLLSLPGVGMSVLEISHRSKPFDEIIQGAEADIRKLAGIPDNYQVLFLQGGASLQFSMVAMNFMPPANKADYIVTGVWSKKAIKEAKRVGQVNIVASTEGESFTRVPTADELTFDPEAAYVHYTTNNTIYGTEFSYTPDSGAVPLIADASSDIFSRPIEVAKHGMIYAGAQKNLAPAGVTLAIVRDDLLGRCSDSLHTMLNYKTHADNHSLYNTPPVFAIYFLRLVLTWLIEQGGLEVMAAHNKEKAKLLYDAIDATDFYRPHAKLDSRSLMNVTFRLPSEELEKKFVGEATRAGLDGLKGHRSVGGIRASIYNAFPKAGVEALVAFMKEFERSNG
jgi:phosphoserine aminotransferase